MFIQIVFNRKGSLDFLRIASLRPLPRYTAMYSVSVVGAGIAAPCSRSSSR